MTQRIIRACLRSSGVVLSGEAEILRCILDSMAVAIRHAVRDAVRLTARPGTDRPRGGARVANPLFCQLVADACQLPVVAGPVEAACWGNTLIQARTLGVAGEFAAGNAVPGPARRPADQLPADRPRPGVGPSGRDRAGRPGVSRFCLV